MHGPSRPPRRVLAPEACIPKRNLHRRVRISLLHVEPTTTSRPSLPLLPHVHLPLRHPPRSTSLILYHHRVQWVPFQMKTNTTNYPTHSPLALIQRKNPSSPMPPSLARLFSPPPSTDSPCKRFTTGSLSSIPTFRETKPLG